MKNKVMAYVALAPFGAAGAVAFSARMIPDASRDGAEGM